MDFLKNQSGRLQQQFNQLTPSQKMLSVSLVIIMAMTLVWWGRYAGQAELEPILDQELAAEDVGRVVADLRGRGIPYSTSGNRVLVPADRKYEVLGSLMYQEIIPRDTSSAASDSSAKSGSPFDSAEQQRDRRNEALQIRLAAMIRGFPDVRNAMVVIDATEKRSFSNPITAKATISVKMKPGKKADSRMVKAAADVVVGGVLGLKPSGVKVIVDGISRLSANDDGMDGGFGGGTWMEAVREAEQYYQQTLQSQLAWCEGVFVHVNVQPKEESTETTEKIIDPKGVISKEIENEHETHTNIAPGQGSGDVGVGANTGSNQKMTLSSSGEGQSVMEKERTKNQLIIPEKTRITHSPAGSMKATSVSVGMPKSYFLKAYMSERRTDKEPGEVVLADYIKNELEKYRTSVKVCLDLKSDDAVFINTYTELVPAASESLSQTASGVSLLMGNHGKEIVLGALALVSLFMVSMMVRKGGAVLAAPTDAVNSTAGTTVDALLAKAGGAKGAVKVPEEDAAEVGESGQSLDGVELDEETVRAQQVVEQVSTLVKENPDTAASLIKRWMNRV